MDSETDPFLSKLDADKRGIVYPRTPRAFLWGIYEGKKESYHEFRTVAEVVAFLTSEYAAKQKPVIYAHNGGKFEDYHALKYHINSDEPIMVISGRLGKFKIGECEFRDSMNILPVGLAAFKKDEIDYALMEEEVRWEPANYEKIARYMRNDCVYLYEVIAQYQSRFGKGLTQAGASMRYWSKTYKVDAPRQSAAEFERLKPFYYGGRVECFKSGYGEEDFTVVDLNSAYPKAMTEKHPFSVVPVASNYLPSDEEIPQCLIKFIGRSHGALPYRDDYDSLTFPDDDETRIYCVTGWEFLAGLELGDIEVDDIVRVYEFADTIDFKDYINDFYNERLVAKANRDNTGDIFAKLFMNSLYGKFASDPLKYREWVIGSQDSYFGWAAQGFQVEKGWADRYLMKRPLPQSKQRHYNVATAASITGYVRAFLYRSLRTCRGLIYCDTDSIAAKDVSGLVHGKALGEWKVEKRCTAYGVAGKKLYAFRGEDGTYKSACKGVDLTDEEIMRVSRGERVLYYPDAPTYSILKEASYFTSRYVRNTAKVVARPRN